MKNNLIFILSLTLVLYPFHKKNYYNFKHIKILLFRFISRKSLIQFGLLEKVIRRKKKKKKLSQPTI